MDDEWEEEEQLVVVELSGIMNNDLSKLRGPCKILDIDSERPMMQLGQCVFVGDYEDVMGTCVLFEEGPPKGKNGCPELKYKCHTMKRLMMQRTFLTEKKECESSTGNGQSTEQQDITFQPCPDSTNDRQQDKAEQTDEGDRVERVEG